MAAARTTIREIRIHLCQTSESSKGVREFVKNSYVGLKKAYPNLPILIRECKGIEPRIWARYDKGVEKSTSLSKLKTEEVSSAVKDLTK